MNDLPGENSFKKLLSSLLFDSQIEIQKKIPASLRCLGFQTKKARLKMIRWQYCTEVDRILSEMDLIISIFNNFPTEEFLVSIKTPKDSFCVFLSGAFLNLVHQTKDKLLRLLQSLEFDNLDRYEKVTKGSKRIRIGTVRKYGIVVLSNIEKEISVWDEELKSELLPVLKLRTKHHHFVSTIPYNESLQRIRLEWLLRNDPLITQYGKIKLKKESDEAFETWKANTFNEIFSKKIAIIDNLNAISEKILRSSIDIPKSTAVYIKEFPENFKKTL